MLAQLLRYQNQVGSQPAEAEFVFYNKVIADARIAAIKGQPCVLTVAGGVLLTGYVVDWKPVYQDAPPGGEPICEVSFTVVDYRWILSGDYVGRRHLDTLDANGLTTAANGIAVLGADITFNRQTPHEHANMDATTGIFHNATAPKFVYERADLGTPSDCGQTDAAYWTYGDAIFWILTKYAPGITQIAGPGTNEVPDTVFAVGTPGVKGRGPIPGMSLAINAANFAAVVGNFPDLARPCEKIDIFGMPVSDALDELFSRTNSNWCLDGNNILNIFSRPNPLFTLTLAPADPLKPITSQAYTLAVPCSLRGTGSIRNVVSKVDVVGGTSIREIQAQTTDILGPIASFDFSSIALPVFNNIALPNTIGNTFYFNFNRFATYRYPFDRTKYAGHKAGKNTRLKDIAKPLFGELLIKRDFNGNLVNPDNECGIYGFKTNETLAPFYFYGASVDLDRSEVNAGTIAYGGLSPGFGAPPLPIQKWVMPIETEIRAWVEAHVALATLPSDRYAAVIRDDLRQKTRENVHVPFPVQLQVIVTADLNGSVTTTYTVVKDDYIALPPGATKDYATSGSIPSGTTPAFTISIPAGVVYDAMGALTNLSDNCASEIGRERCDLEGAFPLFRPLPLGTQLTLVGDGWTDTATGQECVVAVHFDGLNQQLSFAATNYIGANALELAKGFIAQANYRRGV